MLTDDVIKEGIALSVKRKLTLEEIDRYIKTRSANYEPALREILALRKELAEAHECYDRLAKDFAAHEGNGF